MNASRRLLFATVFGLLPLALGCGDSGGSGGAGGAAPDISDVTFEGSASDEALLALLDATATLDETRAAHLTSPASPLSAATAPTFEWAVGPEARRLEPPAPRAPAHRFLFGAAPWLFGPREALAHGDPTNGRAYWLVFTKGDERVMRLFTTLESFTPTSEQWANLTSPEGSLSVEIVTAEFENNLIAVDGGPWKNQPSIFEVE